MPPKPAKLDIVLAMDTSGSMVQNYFSNNGHNDTYLNWTSSSIDAILNETPEARVAIVSWDDDENNTDTNTDFLNVSGNETKIREILNNLSKECYETDHTIYSVGIKKAIQRLDSDKPIDPYNTSRIIIFVTGLSEFSPEPKNAQLTNLTLEEQLKNASENKTIKNESYFGYQIYPITIGINGNFPCEFDNISKISRETRISPNLPRNDNISVETISGLSTAIRTILEWQKSMPLAKNVNVIDCLYPYLTYLGSESKVILKNGTDRPSISPNIIYQSPAVLHWYVGNLSGEDQWTATLHTRINLDLPVDVSEDRKPVNYSALLIPNMFQGSIIPG